MPVHVKVRAWPWATPLLVPSMRAVAVWLMGPLTSEPPLGIEPGSERSSEPLVSVPPVKPPVTLLMSAEPSHPEASLMRFMSPVRWVSMSRKYAPGAVTLKERLCCAVPLVSRVLKTPTSELMFHAKRVLNVVPLFVWIATDERREPSPSPELPVLPEVVAVPLEIDCAQAVSRA